MENLFETRFFKRLEILLFDILVISRVQLGFLFIGKHNGSAPFLLLISCI